MPLHYFAANFILLITKCVLGSMRSSSGQENRENNATNNEVGNDASCDEAVVEEPSDVDDNGNHIEIDFSDKRLLTTMLEVLAISWLSIKRKLDKVSYSCCFWSNCCLIIKAKGIHLSKNWMPPFLGVYLLCCLYDLSLTYIWKEIFLFNIGFN